jgi:hypothetical protein
LAASLPPPFSASLPIHVEKCRFVSEKSTRR